MMKNGGEMVLVLVLVGEVGDDEEAGCGEWVKEAMAAANVNAGIGDVVGIDVGASRARREDGVEAAPVVGSGESVGGSKTVGEIRVCGSRSSSEIQFLWWLVSRADMQYTTLLPRLDPLYFLCPTNALFEVVEAGTDVSRYGAVQLIHIVRLPRDSRTSRGTAFRAKLIWLSDLGPLFLEPLYCCRRFNV